MMTEEDVVGRMLMFRKEIQRQAWGGLDLTVRWTDQLLLYSTLCFILGTYCTIKLLFYYWHQTAAIIDNRYSKG